jgi:N-acetylmuramoyl-L-alanine amidase
MRAIRRLVVHCSATPPELDVGVREIRRWHTDPPPRGRGWRDVGYHFVIRRNGAVESGRRPAEVGAHAAGHNADSLGICLVGGVAADGRTPEDNFRPEQKAALEALLRNLLGQYPGAEVLGHRDLPGVAKACPSFDAKAWWAKT